MGVSLEALEPRVLLTSVWAADLAGPVVDAGDLITSAILDDDRIGLVRGEGSKTRLDSFPRDGQEGSPWTALLEHDLHEAVFAGDGSLAATGWFRTEAGHRDRGLGLFEPRTADPYAVLVADESAPTGFLAGSGLSAPGAFTARMNLVLRDNYMLDAQEFSAQDFEVRYMGVAGGVEVGASIVQATALSTPMPEANVVLEFALVGAGSYRVTLRDGTIIDLAGNMSEERLMGSAFFGQDGMGQPTGPIWTAPPPPSSGPDRPWELVPVVSVQGEETMFDGSFQGSGSSGSGSAPVLVYQTERTDEHGDRVRGFVSWDGRGVEGVGFEAQPTISPIQVVRGGGVLGYEIDVREGFVISLVLWEGPGRGVSVLVNPDGLDAGVVLPNGVRMSDDGSALVFSTLFSAGASQTIWFAHRDMDWQPTEIFASSQDGQDGFSTSITGLLWLGDGPEEQTPTGSDRVYTVLYAAFEQGNLSEGDPAQGGAAGWEFLFRSTIMSGQVLYRPGHAQEPVVAAQPETIAFSEWRATLSGTEYFGLRAGAERAEAARVVLDDRVTAVGWLDRPVNARGLVGLRAQFAEGDDRQFAVLERLGLRPLLILPGIFGTMPDVGLNPFASPVRDWLLERGRHPDSLRIEPMAGTYDDLIASLQLPHVGYTLFDPENPSADANLFVATYDWRMPPAPVHEASGVDLAGPWQRDLDGVVSGVRINSLGVSPTFQHGIDYLAFWIQRARFAWEAMHDGRTLPSVDVYAHSTGGLVARSYIQSDFYGQRISIGSGGTGEALPTVNRLISMAVPHEGAPKAWNLLNDNLAIDPFYKYFIGQMVWSAYEKVTEQGLVISSPIIGDAIDAGRLQRTVDAGHFRTRAEAFIHLYIPTGRALLATYPFIDNDGVPTPAPAHMQNTLSMDLNTDTNHTLHDRVEIVSFFTTDLPTVDAATRMVGPRMLDLITSPSVARPDIYSFVNGHRVPGSQEVWWFDRDPEHLGVGDATVAFRSASLFHEAAGTRGHAFTGLDHNALNSGLDVQGAVLKELGIASSAGDLEDGRYSGLWSALTQAGGRWFAFWRDPVGAYVVDDRGRRSGWSPDEGFLSEIPGTLNYGGSEGWTLIDTSDLTGPITLRIVGVDPTYAVFFAMEAPEQDATARVFRGSIEPGQTLDFPIGTLAGAPADAPGVPGFINLFTSAAVDGMVEGNWIVGELLSRVPEHHAGATDWGGQNYWFQDDAGDLWALWHGGGVHALDNGEHRWVLTNLSDASGIRGEFDFSPGSVSGLVTPWRGFSLHGVVDGAPVVLSWTPQGSRGLYRDADGNFAQGLGLGRLGNGWVIEPLGGVLADPRSGATIQIGPLRAATESQANSRLSFDPREGARQIGDGISFIVLTLDDEVLVLSATPWPEAQTLPSSETTLQWMAEPLGLIPSLETLGILDALADLRDDIIARSRN